MITRPRRPQLDLRLLHRALFPASGAALVPFPGSWSQQLPRVLEATREEAYYLRQGLAARQQASRPRLALPLSDDQALLRLTARRDVLAAALFFECGNLTLALRHFEQLARRAPHPDLRAVGSFGVAEVRRVWGQFSVAIASYSEFTDAVHSALRGAMLRGRASAYRHLGDHDAALQDLRRALRLLPKDYRYLFSRGYLYQHMSTQVTARGGHPSRRGRGDYLQHALTCYRRARQLARPPWPVIDHHLGLAHLALGQETEARHCLADAVRLFRAKPSPLDDVNLGLALLLLGDSREGLSVTRNCLSLLELEPLLCAHYNARRVEVAPSVDSERRRAVETYATLCQDRIDDLSRGNKLSDPLSPDSTNAGSSYVPAVVIFMDMRGFTSWTSSLPMTDHLRISSFVHRFYELCLAHLREVISFVKFEGDGLMCVSRLYAENEEPLRRQYERILRALRNIRFDFQRDGRPPASDNRLELGVGVVVGDIVKLRVRGGGFDYIGHRVNLAARLCGVARPSGVIVATDRTITPEPFHSALLDAIHSSALGLRESTSPPLHGITGGGLGVHVDGSVRFP